MTDLFKGHSLGLFIAMKPFTFVHYHDDSRERGSRKASLPFLFGGKGVWPSWVYLAKQLCGPSPLHALTSPMLASCIWLHSPTVAGVCALEHGASNSHFWHASQKECPKWHCWWYGKHKLSLSTNSYSQMPQTEGCLLWKKWLGGGHLQGRLSRAWGGLSRSPTHKILAYKCAPPSFMLSIKQLF